MASYRELLQQVKSEIGEVDARRAQELIASDSAAIVDVREQAEWDEGHVPGAVHVPRGHLESRIESAVPDRARTVVLYCSSGNRSAFAAKTLEELGYDNVVSLAGGFTDWKRNGLPFDVPRVLDGEKRRRYSRHLLIPEVGEEGQTRLLDSRMLLIGAGGLGSPASLYLAAAGVGTLGIVDDDAVDETNLQRQIVHSTERLGESKADSARRTIEALNPDVTVKVFKERLSSENVDRILGEGWDVIVDGADNFPTRYLLNDASIWHDIPVVHGSIPLRGPDDRLQAEGRPVLPLPLPAASAARARAQLRRGRGARRPPGNRRLPTGERGSQAGPRDRRAARRPPPPLRRARDAVHRDRAPP